VIRSSVQAEAVETREWCEPRMEGGTTLQRWEVTAGQPAELLYMASGGWQEEGTAGWKQRGNLERWEVGGRSGTPVTEGVEEDVLGGILYADDAVVE
jgi:hypothetical protein